MPANILDLLTAQSLYKVQRLLRASEFSDFCSKRGHDISVERLRKLERLGLFRPLLRVRKPDVMVKVEIISATTWRDLGDLEDGEDWKGDTKLELAQFDFHPAHVASWREHGLVWSPYDGPSDHDGEIDADPRRYEAYYSAFQIWDLVWTLSRLNYSVSVEDALEPDGSQNPAFDDLPARLADRARWAFEQKDAPRFRGP